MKQLGLAAVLALVSTSAFAGSFEIPINGGVARIHFGTKCRDRVCGSVSWSGRGERREFKLPDEDDFETDRWPWRRIGLERPE